MNQKPKILYKYRPLNNDNVKPNFTHDIFLKNELYFAHPNQFNDPFDCKIPPNFDDLTKDIIINHFRDITPPEIFETISDNVNKFSLANLKEALIKNMKSHHNVGILSLSANNLNKLMWGHYSNSHRGICIGFSHSELSFSSIGMSQIPLPVNYSEDNKYKWDPFQDDHDAIVEKIYLTKAIDWEYEDEWRVILPEYSSKPKKINPNALVSVYLGCQISQTDKDKIIHLCLKRANKPKVYEITKDSSSYNLNANEISY